MSELSSQPVVVQEIYTWYRDGYLLVNRKYQRKLVWTIIEKQKLIDSILKSYPIPLILLATKSEKFGTTYEILDGLQRLHTIVSFIENGFHLEDGRYFDVDEFTRAKEERDAGYFDEIVGAEKLTRSEVSRVLNYVLPISIIRNASDAVVTDVFGRINSYGHRLSDQERRQAGLVSEFAQFVRDIACEIRGDVSTDILPLHKMPEISIDLPKSKYGYSVQAEDVFWVRQGILRSTDLRDSLDEQVIADIVACMVSNDLIDRSKDVLDRIYDHDRSESKQINNKFVEYGKEKIKDEIKYCLQKVDDIVDKNNNKNLRSIIFRTRTTNPFPNAFSIIFLTIYELSFKEGLVLTNETGACERLENLYDRLDTKRDALVPEKRRENIELVKDLLRKYFVPGDITKIAYGPRRAQDIENTLRLSRIETPNFELKQGILRLDADRSVDDNVFEKVLKSICAIANIGPESRGMIFVGVADKLEDANRITNLDRIEPGEIEGRWVVGVDREARILNQSLERYYQIWRERIDNSLLSQPLKSDVLSSMDLCTYKNHRILMIEIASQKKVSIFNGKVFTRKGDETVECSPEEILAIGARFGG